MTVAEQPNEATESPPQAPATPTLLGGVATKAPEQQATEVAEGGARVPDPAQAKEGDKPTDAAPKAGAPEAYEFKAPEGQQFDQKVLGAYSSVAKELGLTQDAAQKVLDQIVPVMQQREAERFDALRADWRKAISDDKEFGGDRLPATTEAAAKAIATFGDDGLRELLALPVGDHPALVRFMAKVGKAVGGDRVVTGEAPAGDRQAQILRTLYSKSGMK